MPDLQVSNRGALRPSGNKSLNRDVEGDIEMKGRVESREGRKVGETPLANQRAAVQCSPTDSITRLTLEHH